MSALVDRIESARRKNNRHWMDLLRLALAAEPKKARAILRKINATDRRISALFAKVAEGR